MAFAFSLIYYYFGFFLPCTQEIRFQILTARKEKEKHNEKEKDKGKRKRKGIEFQSHSFLLPRLCNKRKKELCGRSHRHFFLVLEKREWGVGII